MQAALDAQRARNLQLAGELYRKALALAPDEPDALHMLGVVCYELGEIEEAYTLIVRALDLTGWKISNYRYNLGLVLARLAGQSDRPRTASTMARYRAWRAGCEMARSASAPTVAVVIPCYNHAAFVERALASVFAQTYRQVELFVIDDGSTDDSAAVARRALKDSPFPSRFVSQANRGAAATIGEGVAQSTAQYVNVLNSDDAFTPDRLQVMVDNVAGEGFAWGFSAVEAIDPDDRAVDPLRDRRALTTMISQGAIPLATTVGFALIQENASISSGNLFFSRELFERLGGFRAFRYNHDWDFCLRALRLSEPRYVATQTYRYRLHGANTIMESSHAARSEADLVLRDYLDWATTTAPSESEWAPCVANWGELFVITVLAAGIAGVLDVEKLRTIAGIYGGAINAGSRGREARHEGPVLAPGA